MQRARYQGTGMYVCVLVFLLSSLISVLHLGPLRDFSFTNYTRTADQKGTSPTNTQHSTDRAISSAQAAVDIIK